jgi:hypothetical protein
MISSPLAKKSSVRSPIFARDAPFNRKIVLDKIMAAFLADFSFSRMRRVFMPSKFFRRSVQLA